MKFLSLVLVIAGCSSIATDVPALENRTLRISASVAGFEYQWRECVRPGLFGACRRWETRVEHYDLNDAVIRNKLSDMGFVARVREKVIPTADKKGEK